jgi:hypothetical protein
VNIVDLSAVVRPNYNMPKAEPTPDGPRVPPVSKRKKARKTAKASRKRNR